jgi:hypothetical protein
METKIKIKMETKIKIKELIKSGKSIKSIKLK